MEDAMTFARSKNLTFRYSNRVIWTDWVKDEGTKSVLSASRPTAKFSESLWAQNEPKYPLKDVMSLSFQRYKLACVVVRKSGVSDAQCSGYGDTFLGFALCDFSSD